jgi:hypothetical protein
MAAEPKTKRTTASVSAFIEAVPDERRRADAKVLLALMSEITGEKPALWGPSIIGFGAYQSPSGPWPITGFSPRKANLVVYVMPGFEGASALLAKLGKHKTGKSCLHLNKLADVDMDVLRTLITDGVADMRRRYGA